MSKAIFHSPLLCALILGGSFIVGIGQLNSVPLESVTQENKVREESSAGKIHRAPLPTSLTPVDKETVKPVCESMNGPSLKLEQTATLIADYPQMQINLQEKPGISEQVLHYGRVGDKVYLMNEFWDAQGCWKWFLVEVIDSKLQGWVHGKWVQ